MTVLSNVVLPRVNVLDSTMAYREARNPEAMAAALQKALEDSELRRRLAANGKELAEREYSPEAYRRSLVTIYRKVLEQ